QGTYPSQTLAERLRIVGYSGNVGIGTTNPTHKLRVEGDVLATSSITASGDISGARYMINGSTVLAILPGSGSFAVGMDISTGNTGDANVFVGSSTGRSNTTGYLNTFIGSEAGYINSTGLANSILGAGAGYFNTTGGHNTIVGQAAGYGNTTGSYNTFLGKAAAHDNNTGGNNTLLGAYAGYFTQTGSANAILGKEAGYGATGNSFSSSTLMGYRAGYGLTTGSDNILVGFQAGYNITSGTGNIIIGYNEAAPAATTSNHLNIGGIIDGDLVTGKVGVGTTNPYEMLTVNGNIKMDNWGNWVGASSDQSWAFNTTSVVTTSKVGIGTLAPGANLHISSTTASVSQDMIKITTGTTAADVFVVKGNGNVGIGTTGPNEQLTVYNAGQAVKAVFGSSTTHTQLYSSYNSQMWTAIEAIAPVGANASGLVLTHTNGDPGVISFVNKAAGVEGTNDLRLSLIQGTRDGGTANSGMLSFYTMNAGTLGERVRIDKAGNVGIGTTAPGYKLDVAGSFNATSVYANGVLLSPGTGSNWSVNGSNIYRGTGNVGIGNTNPGYKLVVDGDVNGVLFPGLFSNINTGSSAYAEVRVISGTSKLRLGVTDDAYSGWTGGSFVYSTDTNGRLALGTGDLERVTISSGGYVGIGTTAPNFRLEVAQPSLNPGISILNNATQRATIGFGVNSGLTSGWIVGQGYSNDGTKDFYIYDISNSAGRMLINTSGNVGIGNTNPTHRLRVEGDVLATSSITATGDISGARYMINGSTVLAILPGNGNFAVGPDISTGSTGDYNVFVGSSAGRSLTDGNNNAFLGYNAGRSNSRGTSNTFIGYQAGFKNTLPSSNTFVGAYAGYNETTGYANSFLGYYAGGTNTSGSANSFVGWYAGVSNQSGGSNTFMGYQAGRSNVSGGSNVFMGQSAGYYNTASYNVLVGAGAGYNNSSGKENSILGSYAGYNNNTGGNNTLAGYRAAFSNTTGSTNTIVGHMAAYFTQTGSGNSIFGNEAGYGATGQSFSSTTLIGYHAGFGLTTGNDNILVGFKAGYNITSGTGNIIIGYDQAAPAATTSNHLSIGGLISGDLVSGNIGIGTTAPTDKLEVRASGGSGQAAISGSITGTTGLNWGIYGQATGVGATTNVGGYFTASGATNNYGLVVNAGNVGIGTTAPASKLEIQGPVQVGNDNVTEYSLKLQRYNSKRAVAHFYTNTNDNPSLLYGENLVWTGERAGTVDSTLAQKPYYEAFTPTGGYREFGFVNATSGNFTGTALVPSLILKSDGKVSISTTTIPRGTLQVSGPNFGTFLAAGDNPTSAAVMAYGNILSGAHNPGASAFMGLTGRHASGDYSIAFAGMKGTFGGNTTDVTSRLDFYTTADNTPGIAMSIDTAGNVGIGTTAPSAKLAVGSAVAGQVAVYGYQTATTGTNYGVVGYATGAGATSNTGGYFYATGATNNAGLVVAAGNVGIGTTAPGYALTVVGTAWVTSSAWSGSDKRWKKNITPLQSSLSKIMRLNPVDFDWRKDEFPGLNFAEGRQIGFIAQEVESVMPEVVTTNKEGYKGISYEQIVPVLTKAIQEQQKQIDELKAKLNARQ
ncbi:MAG: hypothetical protein A2218_13210, partial [Elusimicrobia bacterium RIFOXYA2_FULL_53_38]